MPLSPEVLANTLGPFTATPAIPVSGTWRCAAWGNGMFAMASDVNPVQANAFISSPDGLNWTARPGPVAASWRGMGFGNGQFVAVSTGGTTGYAATSPDGINWTAHTLPSALQWRQVAYGAGLYVAIAINGATSGVATSPDGITWTARTTPNGQWGGIVWDGHQFVAVSQSGVAVMTSPDGINWTAQTGVAGAWWGLAYGNGIYLALSTTGSGNQAMTSPDSINWTGRSTTPPAGNSNQWRSCVFGDGFFVGCGNQSPALLITQDGINYSQSLNNLGSSTAYVMAFSEDLHRFVVGIPSSGTSGFYTANVTIPPPAGGAFTNVLG